MLVVTSARAEDRTCLCVSSEEREREKKEREIPRKSCPSIKGLIGYNFGRTLPLSFLLFLFFFSLFLSRHVICRFQSLRSLSLFFFLSSWARKSRKKRITFSLPLKDYFPVEQISFSHFLFLFFSPFFFLPFFLYLSFSTSSFQDLNR